MIAPAKQNQDWAVPRLRAAPAVLSPLSSVFPAATQPRRFLGWFLQLIPQKRAKVVPKIPHTPAPNIVPQLPVSTHQGGCRATGARLCVQAQPEKGFIFLQALLFRCKAFSFPCCGFLHARTRGEALSRESCRSWGEEGILQGGRPA